MGTSKYRTSHSKMQVALGFPRHGLMSEGQFFGGPYPLIVVPMPGGRFCNCIHLGLKWKTSLDQSPATWLVLLNATYLLQFCHTDFYPYFHYLLSQVAAWRATSRMNIRNMPYDHHILVDEPRQRNSWTDAGRQCISEKELRGWEPAEHFVTSSLSALEKKNLPCHLHPYYKFNSSSTNTACWPMTKAWLSQSQCELQWLIWSATNKSSQLKPHICG